MSTHAQQAATMEDIRKGQHHHMHDHESLIEVIIVAIDGSRYRAMDKQGFIHMAVIADTPTEGLHLRSMVAGQLRAKSGYDPKKHKKIKWDDLFDAILALSHRKSQMDCALSA